MRPPPCPQLPKQAPETKWQAFAKAKGIAPKEKKDRMVYDEERQEWVPRWGYKGKNKDKEEQWIHEVPNNAGTSPSLLPARALSRAPADACPSCRPQL